MNELPFLTRSHLDFDKTAQFSLVLTEQSGNTGDILITGATKSGPFSYKYSLGNTATPTVTRLNLNDVPIFVSVSAVDAFMNPGTCYISLSLHINGTLCQVLLSGYVYSTQPLTWPMSDVRPSIPILVAPIGLTGSDPAAGAEISQTVPIYQMWRLKAIRFSLVTSATVANRRVHVVITTADGMVPIDLLSSVDHAASLTRNYSCVPVSTLGVFSDDNDIIIPIPDELWLNYTNTITTSTTNLQVGDNFSAPTFWIEKHYVNANT